MYFDAGHDCRREKGSALMFEDKPAKQVAKRLGIPWPPANGFFTFKLPTTKATQVQVLLLTDTEIIWGKHRFPLASARASLEGNIVTIWGTDLDIVLAMRSKDDPSAVVEKINALSDPTAATHPELEAKREARRQTRAARAQVEAAKAAERVLVAKYAPGIVAMKLYANGDIEYPSGNQKGSVIGATARVDQSGSERIFRDTRQAYITIEGPNVSLSQKLSSEGKLAVQSARQFAAKVNQLSQQLAIKQQQQPAAQISSGAHAQVRVPAQQAWSGSDIPEQIRKLGELRDAGLLTSDEFEAKKAELLARL
jgi:hypothetical protein